MINLVYVQRLSDSYAKRIYELLTINDRGEGADAFYCVLAPLKKG